MNWLCCSFLVAVMPTIGRIMLHILNIRFFYWYDVSAHSLCNVRHHEYLDTNLAVERNDVKCICTYNFPDHLLWILWKKYSPNIYLLENIYSLIVFFISWKFLFPLHLLARNFLFPYHFFLYHGNFYSPYVFLLKTFYSLIVFFYIMKIFIPLTSSC